MAAASNSNDLLPPREDDKVSGELGKRFVEHLRNQLQAAATSRNLLTSFAFPNPVSHPDPRLYLLLLTE